MVHGEISYEIFFNLQRVVCVLQLAWKQLENQLPMGREAGEVLKTKPVRQHSRGIAGAADNLNRGSLGNLADKILITVSGQAQSSHTETRRRKRPLFTPSWNKHQGPLPSGDGDAARAEFVLGI